MDDGASFIDGAALAVQHEYHDGLMWRCHTVLEKREGNYPLGIGIEREKPYEVMEAEGNLLLYGGASAMWELFIGTANVGAFNATNAQIVVGDSTTAEAATQTDLQAATNKTYVGMDATYPSHTDGTAIANRDCVFKSSFTDPQADYHWQEWIVRIGSGTASPRALNRKVQDFGTKVSGTWSLQVTLTLA